MRKLILFLAAAVPLVAATTTVTQPIVGPDGQPGSGVAYIRITAPCSYGGSYVGEKTITVKFAPSGSPPATTFSVALVPNVGTNGSIGGSGACAGTSYTVSWAFAGGPVQPAETWVVPVSATPVTVDAVKTGPLPAPASQINPSQISAGGGTVGQAMCLTISGWAAGACGGDGGGATWGSIGGTLSDQADLALVLSGKQQAWGDWTGTWVTHSPSYFEPALGNPGTSGYVLSSSISGVRSWVPNGGGGGGGSVTVMADGSVVGSTGVVNYLSGAGLNQIISAGSGQINVQTAVDTAVIQTQAGEQGGGALQCASASASGTTYTCGLGPTLDSYTAGMVLHWVPDHNGTGGATTLNVDTLGAKAVKLPDGSSNPISSSIVAGEMYAAWYDGTVWRLPAAATGGGGGGLSAACTWSTLEAGSCGAGSLTAAMTWAQIEAL